MIPHIQIYSPCTRKIQKIGFGFNQVSDHFGQLNTVIVFDQALYQKAKELTWLRPLETAGVVVRLGGFHIGLNFLMSIGQHFEDFGLKDVWVDTGLFNECTAANQILEPFCESTQTNI